MKNLTISINEGNTFNHEVYEKDDVLVMHKALKKSLDLWGILNVFKNLEHGVQRNVYGLIPLRNHRLLTYDGKKYIEKELVTWRLWKDRGIEVPELIRFNEKEIVYEFIPEGISFRRLLNREYSPDEFEGLLEFYEKIRNIARKDKNPDLLHSDPSLENFLSIPRRNKVIPIDAGTILNPRMNFNDIDKGLLFDTLISISELDVDRGILVDYIRRFKDMLTEEELEYMIKKDCRIPWFADAYFGLREELIHYVIDRKRIIPLEEYKRFIKNYNEYIRGVLEE